MLRRLGICLLLLFSSLQQAWAIDAVVSHTVFYLPDPANGNKLSPNVETYWQINQQTLHYVTTPEKMITAHIKTDIVFTNNKGLIKEDHFILQTVPRANIKELMSHSIIDLRRYFISDGMIRMKFVLTDMADSMHHFTYTDSFTVAPPENKAFYSDLQLLDTILESPEQTLFKKNGHQQVPIGLNFLDDTKNELHYYAELYNTNTLPKDYFPLIQTVAIIKKETDNPAGFFVKKDTITSQSLSLVSGSFNITTQTSGNYYLAVSLESSTHFPIASKSLFFQRLNLHPAKEKKDTAKKITPIADTGIENVNVINLAKTFLAKYTLSDIRAILKMMLPLSTLSETQTINNFLKKPDEIYMRYYIYNHFLNINKNDPGQAWKEYTQKIITVNKRFTTHGTNGYETDRGFIYLRYGEPTEIITVDNEPGSLPYEIWQYNTLTQLNHKEVTNAVFLFYTPNSMSDYRLLHSTVEGEAQNMSWRSYLYTGGQGGSSTTARAEQYLGNK